MTGEDPRRPDLTLLLQSLAGTYLRNTRRADGACARCAGLTNPGYATCYQCQYDYPAALPDLAGFMTYAADGTQAGALMYGYKASMPQRENQIVITLLIHRALVTHRSCPATIVGAPVTHWATVPSTKRRPGPHPLHALVAGLRGDPELALAHASGVAPRRKHVVSGLFQANGTVPTGSHVLLIDDTWTSGGTVLSAVHTLRQAGASFVTVLSIARWLSFDFMNRPRPNHVVGPLHDALLRQRVYDVAACPYTDRACP